MSISTQNDTLSGMAVGLTWEWPKKKRDLSGDFGKPQMYYLLFFFVLIFHDWRTCSALYLILLPSRRRSFSPVSGAHSCWNSCRFAFPSIYRTTCVCFILARIDAHLLSFYEKNHYICRKLRHKTLCSPAKNYTWFFFCIFIIIYSPPEMNTFLSFQERHPQSLNTKKIEGKEIEISG